MGHFVHSVVMGLGALSWPQQHQDPSSESGTSSAPLWSLTLSFLGGSEVFSPHCKQCETERDCATVTNKEISLRELTTTRNGIIMDG